MACFADLMRNKAKIMRAPTGLFVNDNEVNRPNGAWAQLLDRHEIWYHCPSCFLGIKQ